MELMDEDFGRRRLERNLVLGALGYGAAGLVAKAARFTQKIMLECGSQEHFDQLR